MKRIILAIAVLAISASLAFAEEVKTLVKKDFNLKTEGSETFTGSVKSIILADLTRPNSGLTVTGDLGKDAEFEVSPAAVIYNGSNGGLLSLKDIAVGDKVSVNYNKTKEGVLRAEGVKLLPKEETAVKEAAPAAQESKPAMQEEKPGIKEEPQKRELIK